MASLTAIRPATDEYAPYYGRYVDQAPPGDVLEMLEQGRRETHQLLGSLSETKATHCYAPGKWSIKGVVGHVTDAERVFAFRALWVARGDASSSSSSQAATPMRASPTSSATMTIRVTHDPDPAQPSSRP